VLNRNTSLINLMRGYIEMPTKPPPKQTFCESRGML